MASKLINVKIKKVFLNWKKNIDQSNINKSFAWKNIDFVFFKNISDITDSKHFENFELYSYILFGPWELIWPQINLNLKIYTFLSHVIA